jgi:hypothetical protein
MMLDSIRFVAVLLLALPAAASALDDTLTIQTAEKLATLTMADLAAMPVSKLTVDEEKPREFEGVELVELLKRAGVTFGQSLRGPRLATYLVATGADGYRVIVALPEIDPDFTRHPGALVAVRENGQPLSARDGPLQLILPADKRHARWVRSLVSVQIVAAPQVK